MNNYWLKIKGWNKQNKIWFWGAIGSVKFTSIITIALIIINFKNDNSQSINLKSIQDSLYFDFKVDKCSNQENTIWEDTKIISEKIDTMDNAVTAYSTPKSMILNETALVELLIHFKKSEQELVDILIEEKKRRV